MRFLITALSALLVCQMALAVYFVSVGEDPMSRPESSSLLPFPANSISDLVITDPSGLTTSLSRDGDTWTLPDLSAFPADSEKVNTLLNQITRVNVTNFVAMSEGAAERFHVSEDLFERKLEMEVEGSSTTLYLGTSRGTKRVHARRADQTGVVQIPLSIWHVSADPNDWLEKNFLRIIPNKVRALDWGKGSVERREEEGQTDDVALENPDAGQDKDPVASSDQEEILATTSTDPKKSSSGSSWVLARKTQNISLPDAPVERLLKYLSRVFINGIIPVDSRNSYDQENPILSIKITLTDGEIFTYTIFKGTEQSDYALFASSWPQHWFKISSIISDRLLSATADTIFSSEKVSEKNPANNEDTSKPEFLDVPKQDSLEEETKKSIPQSK